MSLVLEGVKVSSVYYFIHDINHTYKNTFQYASNFMDQ
jgi:hypothetical protein